MLKEEKHNIIKRFLEWIGLKEKLHKKQAIPPLFKEGEIWWCYVGENIGNEVRRIRDGYIKLHSYKK